MRKNLWWMGLMAAVIVIVVVIAYFSTKTIVKNPLLGAWNSEDSGYYIEIEDDSEMNIRTTIHGEDVSVMVYYTLDKETRTITIRPNLESYEQAAMATNDMLSANEIDEYLTELMMAFEYSIENDTLTLVENECGDRFIFERVQ